MGSQRGGFSDILAPGFKEMYFARLKMYAEEFSKVFNVSSDDSRNKVEMSEVTGLGAMPVKEEGVGIGFDDPFQGYNSTLTHVTYGLGFRCSEELWEDDLYGIMNKMPSALAVSGKQTTEIVAAAHVNNGFSDSYVGADSEPLFGDATNKTHPRPDGGTGANHIGTAADLSVTSLETLIQIMEETVDDRGLLIAIKPKLLIVPGEGKWAARELLDSMDKPYTSNNEVNPIRDEGLRYFVWHYLTDADAFFLQAAEHYLQFIWRRKPRFKNDDDFETGDAMFKADMRHASGWSGWRGIAGSPGV